MRVGDPVYVSRAATYERLEDKFAPRVRALLRKVPRGAVVSYTQLTQYAGVLPSYKRALPSILRADASGGLPTHRVLTTDGLLVGETAVPNQRALLLAEGVAVDARGGLARGAAPWWAPSHEELFLAPPQH